MRSKGVTIGREIARLSTASVLVLADELEQVLRIAAEKAVLAEKVRTLDDGLRGALLGAFGVEKAKRKPKPNGQLPPQGMEFKKGDLVGFRVDGVPATGDILGN